MGFLGQFWNLHYLKCMHYCFVVEQCAMQSVTITLAMKERVNFKYSKQNVFVGVQLLIVSNGTFHYVIAILTSEIFCII